MKETINNQFSIINIQVKKQTSFLNQDNNYDQIKNHPKKEPRQGGA